MNKYNGAVEDPRKEEEKAKDFSHLELASGALPDWKVKPESAWKKYQVLNQDGSSMCVAFTGRKMLGIENQEETGEYIDLSARDIYDRRYNKPGGGMWGQDALKIICEHGATLESMIPSENMNETQANVIITRTNEDIKIAKKYRGGSYINLPYNIDSIASVIEQGHPVMLHFWFDNTEWTDMPKIKFPELKFDNSAHHSVTAVDFFIYAGEKCLLIEDSWGKFGAYHGRRIITEQWLKARCFFAGYVTDLPNDDTPDKPRFSFSKIMKYGQRNTDIANMQECLRYEKLFPSIDPTGYYGGITRKAVKDFQIKHGIPHNDGWQAGPKTIAKLTEIYSK